MIRMHTIAMGTYRYSDNGVWVKGTLRLGQGLVRVGYVC